MSVRRQLHGNSQRQITVIEDPEEEQVLRRERPARHQSEEAAQEEELLTTSRYSAWGITLGWLRMAAAWVGLFLLVIETGLVFRLIFALAGASAANRFVDFIYDVTAPLVAPFEGIVAERSVDGGVFEPETVIGMGVWAILAILLIALIWVVGTAPVPRREQSRVTRERHSHYRKD